MESLHVPGASVDHGGSVEMTGLLVGSLLRQARPGLCVRTAELLRQLRDVRVPPLATSSSIEGLLRLEWPAARRKGEWR